MGKSLTDSFCVYLGLEELQTEIASKEKELAHITTKIDLANDDLVNSQAEAHRVEVELGGLAKEKDVIIAQVEELKTLLFSLGKFATAVELPAVFLSFLNGSLTIRILLSGIWSSEGLIT